MGYCTVMKRNSDSDVAMRAAVNTIIVNENSGTIDSMAEQLTNVWQTHFQGSENNTGDLDAVAVLYKLMEKYIPGETYTAEAKDLVDLLDNELAPVYTLYDLNLYGPQFDIIPFLTQARTVAQSRPLHVVFRPCLDGSYVKADKYSNDEAIFRMEHICLPACTLYGATSTVLPKPSSPMPEGEWLEGITPKPWGVLDA